MAGVRVKENEPIESAIRRFKKQREKAGILAVLLLVLLLPFTLRGYSRGLCREAFGLAGSIAGVLAAGVAGPAAAKVLLDERLAPPVAAQPLGWAVVFVGTWVG